MIKWSWCITEAQQAYELEILLFTELCPPVDAHFDANTTVRHELCKKNKKLDQLKCNFVAVCHVTGEMQFIRAGWPSWRRQTHPHSYAEVKNHTLDRVEKLAGNNRTPDCWMKVVSITHLLVKQTNVCVGRENMFSLAHCLSSIVSTEFV